MALQTIFLGTPNNNDGDSLYAGGTKINANFSELYTQLSGAPAQALRIDLGTPLIGDPVAGDTLEWSPLNEQFIPSSSTMLKTLAGNTNSYLVLTNDVGKAGVDEDYTGQPNALELILNGRRMWNFRATTTGTTAATRGSLFIGLGNPAATSLAITNRGVTVGGVDGLVIVRNQAEEVPTSSVMLSTGSSGIVLHQTPIIHPDFYKAASDSSGTIVNSGFVQNAISRRGFAAGTSTVTGVRGLAGGGSIATNQSIYIDASAFPTYIEGLTYNVESLDEAGAPVFRVEAGAATHYSYSTTGETAIGSVNPSIMLVTAPSTMRRVWTTVAWTDDNTSICIDAATGANTWYYLYLIATPNGDQTDIVATTSRDYAGIQTKLNSVSTNDFTVIRRLGAFKTTGNSELNGAAKIEPFVTRRLAGNQIRIDYMGNDSNTTGIGIGFQYGSSLSTTQFVVTSVAKDVFAQGLFNSSAATTATASHFSSHLIRAIPPLPGIVAEVAVIQSVAGSPCTLYFYGEPTFSSNANTFYSSGRAAMQRIKPLAIMTTGQTSVEVRAFTVSPESAYVSDATLAGATVFGSTSGAIVRYAFVQQTSGNIGNVTPSLLAWDVQGYTIAR